MQNEYHRKRHSSAILDEELSRISPQKTGEK